MNTSERRRNEVIRRDMRSTLRRLESRPRLVTRSDWQRAHRADIHLHSKRYYPVSTEEKASYNKDFEFATGAPRSGWLTGDEILTLINMSAIALSIILGLGIVVAFWWAILRAVGLVD